MEICRCPLCRSRPSETASRKCGLSRDCRATRLSRGSPVGPLARSSAFRLDGASAGARCCCEKIRSVRCPFRGDGGTRGRAFTRKQKCCFRQTVRRRSPMRYGLQKARLTRAAEARWMGSTRSSSWLGRPLTTQRRSYWRVIESTKVTVGARPFSDRSRRCSETAPGKRRCAEVAARVPRLAVWRLLIRLWEF